MKKLISLVFAGVAALVLSGCGGSGDDYYDDGLTTLFLVDDQGYAYAGIPYICDSMSTWSQTAPNGEFSFYPPDNCIFDFDGLNGTDPYDIYVDEVIYIVDYLDNGKNGIPYECSNFNAGTINYTYNDGIWDGSFDYDADDACVFYL